MSILSEIDLQGHSIINQLQGVNKKSYLHTCIAVNFIPFEVGKKPSNDNG